MTLKVHHLEHSRSQRVLWLLEELDLDYELVRYQRDPKTWRAPSSLRAIHPLGKSPLLEDGSIEGGAVIAESGAIVEHLLDVHGQGRLKPEEGSEAHRRYRFFLHYAEGSVMPPLLVKLIFTRLKKAPLPFFLKPIARSIANKVDATFTDPEIESHLRFLNGELREQPWLLGEELSGADIMVSFPIEAASTRMGFSRYPKLRAYLDRIHARPAYQRALDKGGPYDLGAG
jgi:glutathione S-transferase